MRDARVLASLLIAAGDAFRSGVDEALLYRTRSVSLIAFCATGLVLACLMVEPPAASTSETGTIADARPASRHAWWRIFVCLVMPGAMLDGLASIASFLAQTTADAEVAGVTALVAAGAAGAAVALAFFPGLIHPLRAAALQRVAARRRARANRVVCQRVRYGVHHARVADGRHRERPPPLSV